MVHTRVRKSRAWIGYGVEAIRTVSEYLVRTACLARMPSWFAPVMRDAWRKDAAKREMQQATTGKAPQEEPEPEGGADG